MDQISRILRELGPDDGGVMMMMMNLVPHELRVSLAKLVGFLYGRWLAERAVFLEAYEAGKVGRRCGEQERLRAHWKVRRKLEAEETRLFCLQVDRALGLL